MHDSSLILPSNWLITVSPVTSSSDGEKQVQQYFVQPDIPDSGEYVTSDVDPKNSNLPGASRLVSITVFLENKTSLGKLFFRMQRLVSVI